MNALDRLEKLLAEATPGPCKAEDADLIAALRNAAPSLIKAVGAANRFEAQCSELTFGDIDVDEWENYHAEFAVSMKAALAELEEKGRR